MADRIRFREIRRDDFPYMADADMANEYDDYGFSWHDKLLKQFENPDTEPRPERFIVERAEDDKVLGTVSWHWVSYGPNEESKGLNIGIVLRTDSRGQGYGTEAQRLLAEHLFETTPVRRIEASTDLENLAEQRSLEKAGFTREGVLRAAQVRSGKPRDMVVYSRLRTD